MSIISKARQWGKSTMAALAIKLVLAKEAAMAALMDTPGGRLEAAAAASELVPIVQGPDLGPSVDAQKLAQLAASSFAAKHASRAVRRAVHQGRNSRLPPVWRAFFAAYPAARKAVTPVTPGAHT